MSGFKDYALADYQEKAVSKLIHHSNYLIEDEYLEGVNIILLQAITGAGKTIMMGDYIKKMFSEHDNISFIWVSIGNGELVEQSSKKIKEMLINSARCLNHDDIPKNDCLKPKDVLFINWEKFNSDKNTIMKKGERRNFPSLLEKTNLNETNIILIIDEAHHTASSDKSLDLREDFFKPIFTIEVTATPKRPKDVNSFNVVQVKIKDVIDAGIIKKGIIINSNYSKHKDELDVYQELILHALEKHNELYKEYDYLINPLVLIQLPDGEEGKELQEHIMNYLNSVGVGENEISIWLSEEKVNLEKDKLTEFDNQVKVLIFKTAIATGWDCPRAQILVKFREIKSKAFNTQVVGRIIRMPERKHYTTDILNYAYIYTNENEAILDPDNQFGDVFLSDIVEIKEKFKNYSNKKLPSNIIIREKQELQNDTIEKLFRNAVSKKSNGYFNPSKKTAFDMLKETEVSTTILQEAEKSKLNVSKDIESHEHNKRDYEIEFRKIIKNISPKSKTDFVKQLLELYFKEDLKHTIHEVHRIVKAYEDDFKSIFAEIFKPKKDANATVEEKTFSIPKEKSYFKNTSYSYYEKCLYEKTKESKYVTEKTFEKEMDKLDNVLFWFKNNDKGIDSICIPYTLNGIINGFYPDYVVCFTDGTFGYYEVKDTNTADSDETRAKMFALGEFLKDYSEISYGLVVINQKNNTITNDTKNKNKKLFN